MTSGDPSSPTDRGHRPFETDAEAQSLCEDFLAARLPKAAWTHRAHLTAALWHLDRMEPIQALDAIRTAIKRFNRSVDTIDSPTSGYHETITVLYVRVVAEYRRTLRSEEGFAIRANQLYDALGSRELPFRYYSRDRLGSSEARLGYLEPDIAPLPDW